MLRTPVKCLLLAAVLLGAACGRSDDGGPVDRASDTPDDADASTGRFGDPADGGDAAPPGPGCTGDLRSIVDPSGKVTRCAVDQGCARGTCVAACTAAAASKGSLGCEFVAATPTFFESRSVSGAPCFAVFIANGWEKPAKLTVQRGGSTFDVTSFGRISAAGPESSWPKVPATGVPPGKVAVLFLSADPNAKGTDPGSSLTCPVPPAIPQSTAVRFTGRGTAWKITSDTPVTGYDIIPYGGAKSYLPSAELLLPTSAWGKNYVAAMPPAGLALGEWGQIVALRDGTTVKVLPTDNLPSGAGVAGSARGVAVTYSLSAGEFIQWGYDTDPNHMAAASLRLSGTILDSNEPVAFVGGHTYMCFRSQTTAPSAPMPGGCDSGHQMVPPISALASEYVGAPYATRRANNQPESIVYRIVAAANGTTLSFDPPIANAPGAASRGQAVDFETEQSFVVRSQDAAHPFFMAQAMSGCHVLTPTGECVGDEDYVNVLPPAQFLSRYFFFTDPTYGTTTLSLTRKKNASGFADVKLGCLGTVTGWKDVGKGSVFQTTTVTLVSPTNSGACTNGPQEASSDGPFGVTVWGIDKAASYAYPAGGNAATLNTVTVPVQPR